MQLTCLRCTYGEQRWSCRLCVKQQASPFGYPLFFKRRRFLSVAVSSFTVFKRFCLFTCVSLFLRVAVFAVVLCRRLLIAVWSHPTAVGVQQVLSSF